MDKQPDIAALDWQEIERSSEGVSSRIINADCSKFLRKMDDASVDFIITSPPYADQRKSTYGGIHADDYVAWFTPIAKQFYRVLKPAGSFRPEYQGTGSRWRKAYLCFGIDHRHEKNGVALDERVYWHKKNCYPGKWPNRFRNSWERCLHFTKSKNFVMNQDRCSGAYGRLAACTAS